MITGVFKDFKVASFNDNTFPMRVVLREVPDKNVTRIAFKLHRANDDETMAQIRKLWDKHFPKENFSCNDIYTIYMSYNHDVVKISRLLLMYSLISLFLTAFGLFGIAWYAAEQRTREIGIRKVNGATRLQIMLLLNRPFLAYIAIAYIITIPFAYYLMQKWLEQFVDRADIGTGEFTIPLLITAVMSILTVSLNSWHSASINPIDAIKE